MIEVLVKELLPGQVLRQYKVTYLPWVKITEHTSLAALAMSEKAAGADIVNCGGYETPEKAEKRRIEARRERRDGSVGGRDVVEVEVEERARRDGREIRTGIVARADWSMPAGHTRRVP